MGDESKANPGKYPDAKKAKKNYQAEANQRGLGRLRKKQSRSMDWTVWNADALGWLVHCATRSGYALLFGKTRDGGALTLTVYLDGDREVLYLNDLEEAAARFDELAALFQADADTAQADGGDIPF